MRRPRPAGEESRPSAAWAFAGGAAGCLLAVTVVVVTASRGGLGDLGIGFVLLAGLALVVGPQAQAFLTPPAPAAGSPIGRAGLGGTDLTSTFLFAILLGWGTAPALAVHLVVGTLQDLPRLPWQLAVVRVGRRGLGLAAAGTIAAWCGLRADLGTAQLPAVALAALALFVVEDLTDASLWPGRPGRSQRPGRSGGTGRPGGAGRPGRGGQRGRTVRLGRPHWWGPLVAELYRRVAVGTALLALAPLVVIAAGRSPWLVLLLLPALWVVTRVAAGHRQKEHEARHDGLTGLLNRTALAERAASGFAAAEQAGTRVGLLLLDLDRFKAVNDRCGHEVGDRLLVVAAARLTAALRPGDVVARLGGDEFAVLLPALPPGPAGRMVAAEVAGRVRGVVRAPYEIDGQFCEIDVSVGVALYPDHAADLPALSRCADIAMYAAKQHRLGIQSYGPRDARRARLRARTTAELGYALEHGQLELHYQPQAEIADGRVRRAEALLRWRHPSRGLLLPGVFVPLAESAGLIRPITSWALDTALAQAARWHAAGLAVAVALNVSARDLNDPRFVGSVASALTASGLPATALTFEVTEQALAGGGSGDGPAGALRALAELGVTVSLDDFGTGLVSLEALRRLPIGEIKLDRAVIVRMAAATREAVFVRAVVRLASDLGLRVVAEGVETPGEWRCLAGFGADAAQGWHVAPALPAALLTPWLAGPGQGRIRGALGSGRPSGEPFSGEPFPGDSPPAESFASEPLSGESFPAEVRSGSGCGRVEGRPR